MQALEFLGLTSLVFVITFTWHAATSAPGVGQTPRSAIIEAWVNIAIGFSINFVANLALLPLVGAHLTGGSNFWLGCIYTAISMGRQYVIRRWFNAQLHAVAKKLGGAA